ncbi:MAG: iron donor protein CyaY [Deltaproteobacteria bacterium]|nr:iron donor protein CyaY [Planctomycetota bacterium]MBM4279263.1 iron donor protein CyaY [Deltaproteobacteria bacterium]
MTTTKTTSDTMDEATFRALAGEAVAAVRRALDAQDPDVVECVPEADVVKIAFPTGLPFVLNMQRPVREVWLAAERQAWHFRYDGARWRDKRNDDELFATVTRLVQARAGVTLSL